MAWPHWLIPPALHNRGNYVISLGELCRWLAAQAEALGAQILPGTAAAEVLYGDDGAVAGVATGDFGVGSDGAPGPNFQPGTELSATFSLFAEGCRGSLSRRLREQFRLDARAQLQTHGLGFKEVWRTGHGKPGDVVHTVGWPLRGRTYGGGFLYHMDEDQLAVGFVVGLDYANPYLDPFEEFQRFKSHPAISSHLAGGERLSVGARTLVEGGAQALPKLTFPGGALIGDGAGLLNVAKIKGIHNAIRSGMLAAEAVFAALQNGAPAGAEPADFARRLARSGVAKELRLARNVRPSMRLGLWPGVLLTGIDQLLLRGRAPWTLPLGPGDHDRLGRAQAHVAIAYPAPDGEVTFDRPSSVFLSGTNHAGDQPAHLRLADATVPVGINLTEFAGPEARVCPAEVYEFVNTDGGKALRLHPQNCLHCKACDIKDPTQNIRWVVPEGGGGPNYRNM